MLVDKTRTYVGIVEDNQDPLQLGRCKIRVLDIFDMTIPTADLPWASSWKDLNGNGVNIPDVGKVVVVVFDSGNVYFPEYIYSIHYNINLEKKLSSLDPDTYITMKALIFDHKTQIFVNDEEGLKIDYKYNCINMLDSSINISLKDCYGRINIGDASADQQSILGTNFMNWMDTLVQNLLGSNGGPYLGNLGSPVVANPALIDCLQQYQQLRDPKFLSKNIYMNDNGSVNSIRQADNANPNLRPAIAQIGDAYKSTVEGNDLTTMQTVNYTPVYGNGDETPVVNNGGALSTADNKNVTNPNPVSPPVGQPNSTLLKIIQAMQSKGYTVETKTNYVNLCGIRYSYPGNPYPNTFCDKLFAFYMDSNQNWECQSWAISTMPGLYQVPPSASNPSGGQKMKAWAAIHQPAGLGILYPAQYLNIYQFNQAQISPDNYTIKAKPYFSTLGPQNCYRDTHFTSDNIYFDSGPNTGNWAMYIHRGFPGGSLVQNWSEGCQIFSKEADLNKLVSIIQPHLQTIGNHFHYTLMTSDEIQ